MASTDTLKGRIAVVTGANSGLGLETAREFARMGAHVVMACRSAEKAEAARRDILSTGASGTAEIVPLDLGDLASVRRCAADLRKRYPKLDLLVNNAGVMGVPLLRTVDGFEMQFGTNHLGHFVLTAELLEPLLAADAARVVAVSSIAHVAGVIRWSDPNWTKTYYRWPAYCQSKLANLLFARELDRRFRLAGAKARAMACHPGVSATNLQFVAARIEGSALAEKGWELSNRLLGQSAADGAKPTIFAATSPLAEGGAYYGPDGFAELHGEAAPAWVAPSARKPETARRLWSLSEDLTGARFALPG
ncbi:MAG: oxidoreductase [Polyangiales bacterium]